MSGASIGASLRASRGVAHKGDIAPMLARLGLDRPGGAVAVGDDCAAIPDGDGFLLLAIEGFLNAFVESDPFFAGYCGVMVNASDVAAMGGRPIAVVDALWSDGADGADEIARGLALGAATYGVPVVGGHTNLRNPSGAQLSVAILGRATRLITSFDARPGDVLVAAIDLRGRMRAPAPWWDASSGAQGDGLASRLRDDLALLPGLAEDGLCRAGKDVSMGGVIGTLLMLAEASGVGMIVNPARVPRPDGVPLELWLTCFPSFGFVLAVDPGDVDAVLARFAARGIGAGAIGKCREGRQVWLVGEDAPLWDFAVSPLMGVVPRAPAGGAG